MSRMVSISYMKRLLYKILYIKEILYIYGTPKMYFKR
nr:MAG TPA: hypothetical protein [Caudoviricetes sp.]